MSTSSPGFDPCAVGGALDLDGSGASGREGRLSFKFSAMEAQFFAADAYARAGMYRDTGGFDELAIQAQETAASFALTARGWMELEELFA